MGVDLPLREGKEHESVVGVGRMAESQVAVGGHGIEDQTKHGTFPSRNARMPISPTE
jgi:hypothetical protein